KPGGRASWTGIAYLTSREVALRIGDFELPPDQDALLAHAPDLVRREPDRDFIGAGGYDLASRRIPLLELRNGDCRFPVNEAARGELHLFCGLPQDGESSWCRHHRLRCCGGTVAEAPRSGRPLVWVGFDRRGEKRPEQ